MVKATSLFGGVQAFHIIITIIKSKLVAILLGPFGIGVVGLLTSTIGLISGLTNFGLKTSAVKDISEANGTGNQKQIALIITVLRKLVWLTGLLGSIVTLVFSPILSQMTFGNKEYTAAFIWLSITLLINQLTAGQLVLLQGMRRLKDLAKANLYGSIIGLFITIPIYYFFGVRGIVPVIIITSVSSFLLSQYFSRKVKIQKVKVTPKKIIANGRNMMAMGLLISITEIIGLAYGYLERIYITHVGGIVQTGFFTAGFAIINTYTAMIFSALDSDFYPRLSSIAKDNKLSKLTINQQSEIAILIIAPILILFIVFVRWAIIILYSKEFLNIYSMLQWASLGVFFRTISWAITILLLAKGASRAYFWNEFISNSYMFGLTLLGYYLWGLTGIGITHLLSYMIYTVQVFILARIRYQFSYTASFMRIFIVLFGLALTSFILINVLSNPLNYVVGVVLFVVSSLYSYRTLNKLIGINELIQKFITKK